MDFGGLPPEVNSARMYTGPGATPMTTAASAWSGLAAELDSTAAGYETLVTQLAGEEWLGPASTAMADAVAPYIGWLRAAAAQADQTAMQARASVAAYEVALAAVVPPPLIVANRMQLAQLVARNVYGQNTAAIAALEAQYGQMWAQDAAAMYEYAAATASASTLTPFGQPPQIVDPSAATGQSGAVARAAATAAGTSQSTLSRLISGIPKVLQGLATPLAESTASTSPFGWLWQILFGTSTFPTSIAALLTDLQPYASFFYNTEGLPYFSIGMANNFVQSGKTLGLIGGATTAAAAAGGAAQGGLAGLGGLMGGGEQVSAGLGHAPSIGRLSVPPTWAQALPDSNAIPTRMPIETLKFAPEGGGAGNLLGGMPLSGPGHSASGSGPRYGVRPTVMARPPFAG
ncbi:PPE family protein [Mycobacterium simiae]|uniref:PPE family protein n=1 Tax=Mycobacterium simiae TaxID=1784 RepID=A0A5B1BUS5_MYCSI|nr:PPE family protein [Mycobacterium simiae]KAA1251083.1 PPE family protein [Mycobacterium simiae]